MADTYQPNSAAALTIAGGQPAFVEDQFLTPNAAARFDIGGGQPSFVQGQAYHPNEAARLDILAVQPTFRFTTHYIPHEAALFSLSAAQPSYEMGEGALEYRPEAAALLSITGAQPAFIMRTPESLSFTPLRAARINFSGGQPYFVGGDLIAAAPPVFPFEWDGNDPLQEEYELASAVNSFDDDSEQRWRLSAIPSGKITFGLGHLADVEFQAAQAALLVAQGGKLLIPLWQYASPLTVPLGIGEAILAANLAGVPLQPEMFVMVWSAWNDYQANVLIDADDSGAILAYVASKTWPVGARLVPLVIGRLAADEAFTFEDLAVASQARTFTIERWLP